MYHKIELDTIATILANKIKYRINETNQPFNINIDEEILNLLNFNGIPNYTETVVQIKNKLGTLLFEKENKMLAFIKAETVLPEEAIENWNLFHSFGNNGFNFLISRLDVSKTVSLVYRTPNYYDSRRGYIFTVRKLFLKETHYAYYSNNWGKNYLPLYLGREFVQNDVCGFLRSWLTKFDPSGKIGYCESLVQNGNLWVVLGFINPQIIAAQEKEIITTIGEIFGFTYETTANNPALKQIFLNARILKMEEESGFVDSY